MLPSAQPRVFISYARSDGAEYAASLRHKLEKAHISLWQDIISERAGRDWWLQITDALDHVDYMVLVATPDCLQSPNVLKEWRYARQNGVCVLPVLASSDIDFDSLPRWMRSKQFADLNVKDQWALFLSDIRHRCQTQRVPFMAEDLPPDFVPRPEQSEQLIAMLLDDSRERQRNPVAITTALRGGGGFGKTMLARAICHDVRVQEVFDDGILWVTLGESLSEERLKAKIADLVRVLAGQHTEFETREAAASRLRELLEDRDILMVIDDVWNHADLHPFLQGGEHCARLITTRNLDILPRHCSDVKVDSMQEREAIELLSKGLPGEDTLQLSLLADRLGKWPLLLGIVNGTLRQRIGKMNQSFDDALGWASKALERRGLTAFDPANAEERERAVESTMAVSLELFSETDRHRFQELAIFHEDVNVPLDVVSRLWQAIGGLDDFDSEDLCVRLHQHSLLQTLDLTTREIRLHDVMRTFLQTALALRIGSAEVQCKLVDAWGDPLYLPNDYAWRWYAYHLVGAVRHKELRELLLSPIWLQAKLAATDVTSLMSEFDYLPEEVLQLVQGAIRLSSHVIAKDHGQFASQMMGRLLMYRDSKEIDEFIRRIPEGAQTPWLQPLQLALLPPGTGLVCTLEGHKGEVNAVALTADGKVAVSASEDHTLKVWELSSGREVRTLKGHRGVVWGVAVSNDGRLAVSTSGQGLKVWDLSSGRELRTLKGHRDFVWGVAMSNDGRLAVSASADHTLKVWELSSGRELCTLQGHKSVVKGVAVVGDGRLAVSASADHTLKVWDLSSGRELRTLTAHTKWVNAVAVTPDGRLAVSASGDGTLKVWSVESGRELRTLEGHTNSVTSVALSADGRLAVSVSEDQTLKVWELSSGRELRTLTGHHRLVKGVAVSRDGRLAVSTSADRTLKVWDWSSRLNARALQDYSYCVTDVAVSGDGRLGVFVSSQGVKVWDLSCKRELPTLHPPVSATCLALSLDGRLAVSASRDNMLTLWQVESGLERELHTFRELRTFKGRRTRAGGPGASLVTRKGILPWERSEAPQLQKGVLPWEHWEAPNEQKEVRPWESLLAQNVQSISKVVQFGLPDIDDSAPSHDKRIRGVTLSINGSLAVSASVDQSLKVWDVTSGRELYTLTGHTDSVNGVTLSSDGRLAISASDDKTLKVWDLSEGKELRTLQGHTDYVNGVALSGDGKLAVSASRDKTLKVWEVGSGRVLRTLEGHTDHVNRVTMSRVGGLVVSASDDQTLKVWDLETGKVLATFTCDAAASCCAYSDALKLIIAGDAGGGVHFLRLET